ncbi:unnamed protein product [Somion occarium]|uniref:Ubiquitin-like domain-containing protein n=1 Tax=Somion occarium TaxID=3059160 RepID=A0ABP1CWM5_9APHY
MKSGRYQSKCVAVKRYFTDFWRSTTANGWGRTFVHTKRYTLLSDTGSVIDDFTWNSMVRPGSTLSMSALVLVEQSSMRLCPRCKFENVFSDDELENRDLKCRRCQCTLQLIILEAGRKQPAPAPVSQVNIFRHARPCHVYEDEIQLITRISMVFRPPRNNALCIGIEATEILSGFIKDELGFENVVLMVDEPGIREIQALVIDISPKDLLVFHFSGCDIRLTNHDKTEDGIGEVLLPVDYSDSGVSSLSDEKLRCFMIDPLPAGFKLTAIFHTYISTLDIPFIASSPVIGDASERLSTHSEKATRITKGADMADMPDDTPLHTSYDLMASVLSIPSTQWNDFANRHCERHSMTQSMMALLRSRPEATFRDLIHSNRYSYNFWRSVEYETSSLNSGLNRTIHSVRWRSRSHQIDGDQASKYCTFRHMQRWYIGVLEEVFDGMY